MLLYLTKDRGVDINRSEVRYIQKLILVCIFTNLAWLTHSWATPSCSEFLTSSKTIPTKKGSSFNDVLSVMNLNPYDLNQPLPLIPLQMWKMIAGRLTFFVGDRSREILEDRRDFRIEGQNKPIHPMGVGLVGSIKTFETPWTGAFSNKTYPVLARASLSQGNPHKLDERGRMQPRSTAMAIKVFNTEDLDEPMTTGNAVFQNDLNGLLGQDSQPLNYLESTQTNQPNIDFTKISYSYEVLTLLGVAFGSLSTPRDKMSQFPFVNPQLRPPHSLGELGVENLSQVNTPTWIKIVPRLSSPPVSESDFRLEIFKTMQRDGVLSFDLYASDYQDDRGQIQWVAIGELTSNQAILSEGVDRNLLFPHDPLNSAVTDTKLVIPSPQRQHREVYQDIQ
jgi:hypothetical protein